MIQWTARSLLLVLVVLLSAMPGCAKPKVSMLPQQLEAVSILAYGARGDGSDDRAAIQAALNANAGGTVIVPAGRWTVGRAGSAYYCLSIPAGTTLVGEGTLVMAGGTAPSVRLLELDAPGVTVQDLTLDGNQAAQDPGVPPNRQRHGIFARARFTARRVRATGFTGDGIYAYPGSDGSVLDAVICEGNGRNGATWQSSGGSVTGSTFRGNRAQQFDTEPGNPGHVDDMRVSGNTFDTTDGAGNLVSNDYALTVCGSAGGASSGWTVEDNTIVGGVYVVWAQDVTLRRNTALNPTSKPSVTVYRADSRVTIGCAADAPQPCSDGNDLTSSVAATAIAITGTGTGQAPGEVTVRGNRITAAGATGILASGALSVVIADNVITSSRGTGGAAIGVRATDPATPFATVTLLRNQAAGWQRGVNAGGVIGSPAQLGLLVARDNRLGAPMWLDDGSGALQRAELAGNTPTDVARWPDGAELAMSCETTMTRSPR
jgi:hypothetical protein